MLTASDLDTIDIHTLDLYASRGYPWAEWDLLRREAPVYWYDRPGIEPFWAITRYDDVHAVGRDAATFVNSGRRLRLHSIEHEDALASQLEGVKKAISVLKNVMMSEPAGGASWTV